MLLVEIKVKEIKVKENLNVEIKMYLTWKYKW